MKNQISRFANQVVSYICEALPLGPSYADVIGLIFLKDKSSESHPQASKNISMVNSGKKDKLLKKRIFNASTFQHSIEIDNLTIVHQNYNIRLIRP